jgi:hypothetical protein
MLSTLQNLVLLGVGTTADSTNPFSAKLNNALWVAKTVAEGGDGNLRYKLSKESAAKTLSFLFQDNFSGRAEIGLTGDDDLHFKVSADGSSWLDAITIDRTAGKLSANQGFTNPTTTRAQLYAAPFDALAFNGMQVDGGGDVSQLNGTTQLTLGSDTEAYVTDTFLAAYKNSGAVVKARQLAGASFPAALSGYNNAVELKATTALSSLANGDYAKHIGLIEGYRVARLGWGASGAQSLAYAFQYYSPRSATIFVKLSNSDRSRCYYDEKAVVAGWNWVTGTGAGDTSGTWNAATGIGLRIEVFSAGKTASPATPGSWGSTNTTATTGSTQNNLSSTNDAAVVTGLILLPGIELPSATRAPLIMRPYATEFDACQRYFERWVSGTADLIAIAQAQNDSHIYGVLNYRPKRTAPTIIFSATSDFGFEDGFARTNADAIDAVVMGAPFSRAIVHVQKNGAFIQRAAYWICGTATGGGINIDARL